MASGASGVGSTYPSPTVRKLPDVAGRVLRGPAGYKRAMNIGKIVREVEVLPDTDEEPLPVPEPAPSPLSEPAQQPV
jgi:hypothetical protein